MSEVVFFHGFSGRGDAWRPVIRRLKYLDRELEAWTPDLPGHQGPWPAPDAALPASFEATVDMMAEQLAAACVAPPHLVGYSLGGRLALGLGVRHPGLVSRLTLIGARPGLGAAARRQRAEADDQLARELEEDLPSFIEKWQALPLFESQRALPSQLQRRQQRQRLSHSPRDLAWALRTLSPGRMPDFRSCLPRLEHPTRLVVGELDTSYRAVAEDMRDALPVAELSVVAGCGHNVALEAPGALAELLARPIGAGEGLGP